MDPQAFRRPLRGTGLLFKGCQESSRMYLGSCFSVVEPTIFLTAAHCIKETPLDQLWINHFGGPAPNQLTKVHRIEWVDEYDLAILQTDAPLAKWAAPFKKLKYAVDFGEEVCAFGYPQDLISQVASKETARMLRGSVQRPFFFERQGRKYSAYELSFPCSPGLSGSPLFLASDPATVIGIVTENFETYTVIDEYVDEKHPNEKILHEARRVITYGVAANVDGAVHAIEKLLGHRLPDPEPESGGENT